MPDHSFFGRYKRTFDQAITLGAIAKGIVFEPKDLEKMNELGVMLHQKLGHLKGPYMKIAQFLATIPDALPPAIAQHLLTLQAHAPAMGVNFVKRRMSTELGLNWQNHFASFDLTPRFAASLGQVHYARLHDGQEVACKLQYPMMAGFLEQDMASITLLFKGYRQFFQALDMTETIKEIHDRLKEELDYTKEAKNMALFQDIFKKHPHITIANVMNHLSTHKLLVMEWIDGTSPLESFDNLDKDGLVHQLFYSWYYPLYAHNILHGDPHPGNYLFCKGSSDESDNKDKDSKNFNASTSIGLLDFGCVKQFPPQVIEGILSLYYGLYYEREELILQGYANLGFQNLTAPLVVILNQWARLLYDPILDNCVRPIQNNHSGKDAYNLAQKLHGELHRLGGVSPPRAFILLDRAAVGIGAVCMRLQVSANWFELFHQCLLDASQVNPNIKPWLKSAMMC